MLISGLQMSTEKQAVTVQDLAEEAKKRVIFLIMCALGLSYLLSRKYYNFCSLNSAKDD